MPQREPATDSRRFERGYAAGPCYLRTAPDGWHAEPQPPAGPLDSRAVAECLLQGYVSPPDTLQPGAVALRPGEAAVAGADGRLSLSAAALPVPSRGGLRPALLDILADLGDAPCGVLLSGGVDSAWLAALVAQRGPARGYTTVFPHLQQVDFAADAAHQAGLQRTVVEGDSRLIRAWQQLVRETGLPQGGLGGAALLLAAEAAAAEGCTTLLSGLGADEIAGGRPNLLRPHPWTMRRLPRLTWSEGDLQQAYGLVPPRSAEWAVMLRLRADMLAPEILQRDTYLAEIMPAPPVDPEQVRAAGPAVGGWLYEHAGRLGSAMLPTIAAIERLAGVRIVLPYLDPRAVERGLADYGPDKPAIRQGSRRELPDQIRARPKLARVRPEVHWLLSDPLPDSIAEALSPRALAATRWFDPVTVHHWLQLVQARPFTKLNRLRTRMLLTVASLQMLSQVG